MANELKEIKKNYDFYITDEICSNTESTFVKDVTSKLLEIQGIYEENKKILDSLGITDYVLPKTRFVFHLSTYGGVIYSGLGIHDIIKHIDTTVDYVDVTVICYGKVMSAGVFIMLGAKRRVAFPSTTFMIHDVSSFSIGKLKDIEESVEESKRLRSIINNIIVENTKFTMDEIDAMIEKKQDLYLNAKEALEKGLIQSIL